MRDSPPDQRRSHFASWVLCGHTLQQMCKGLGWNLAQGLLVVAYFVAVVFTQYSANRFGAAGLELFQRMTYLNLVFMTMIGISCFSNCVVSERETGTLELLRMTGLGRAGFLVGRWLPLFIGCAIMLILQIPCMSFAITLGGVLPGQLRAMMVLLLVHLFFVASVGLWISVVCKTSQRAVLVAICIFSAWFIGPMAIETLLNWVCPTLNNSTIDQIITRLHSWSAFGSTQRLFQSSSIAPDLWSRDQSYLTLWGAISIAGSWWGLERYAAPQVATEKPMTARPRRQWGAGVMAVFWKDFRTIGGGWRWFLLRLICYPALTLAYGLSKSAVPFPFHWLMIHEASLRLMGWDTAIVLAQLYHREMSEQTWGTLLCLPMSRGQIAYSKFAGTSLALLPGWLWVAVLSFYVPILGCYGATTVDVLFFTSIVVLGCHVTVLVSVLFPQFSWTIALLLGVLVAHLELIAAQLVIFNYFPMPFQHERARLLLIGWFLIFTLMISAGLHKLIANRLGRLSD